MLPPFVDGMGVVDAAEPTASPGWPSAVVGRVVGPLPRSTSTKAATATSTPPPTAYNRHQPGWRLSRGPDDRGRDGFETGLAAGLLIGQLSYGSRRWA